MTWHSLLPLPRLAQRRADADPRPSRMGQLERRAASRRSARGVAAVLLHNPSPGARGAPQPRPRGPAAPSPPAPGHTCHRGDGCVDAGFARWRPLPGRGSPGRKLGLWGRGHGWVGVTSSPRGAHEARGRALPPQPPRAPPACFALGSSVRPPPPRGPGRLPAARALGALSSGRAAAAAPVPGAPIHGLSPPPRPSRPRRSRRGRRRIAAPWRVSRRGAERGKEGRCPGTPPAARALPGATPAIPAGSPAAQGPLQRAPPGCERRADAPEFPHCSPRGRGRVGGREGAARRRRCWPRPGRARGARAPRRGAGARCRARRRRPGGRRLYLSGVTAGGAAWARVPERRDAAARGLRWAL